MIGRIIGTALQGPFEGPSLKAGVIFFNSTLQLAVKSTPVSAPFAAGVFDFDRVLTTNELKKKFTN